MKKLRIAALTFLTIGAIFTIVIFGVTVSMAQYSDISFLNVPGILILGDIAAVVFRITGITDLYNDILLKNEMVGIILSVLSLILALIYLIPIYLPKNNHFRLFGSIFALIFSIILLFLIVVAILYGREPRTTGEGLTIFNFGLTINGGFFLLFVGPLFTFLGAALAISNYVETHHKNSLTSEQKDRKTAINLETGKIGARGIVPNKVTVSIGEIERPTILQQNESANQSQKINVGTGTDLQSKMLRLKAKMAENARLNQSDSIMSPEQAGYNNSRWSDSQHETGPSNKPTFRVGDDGQYVRTVEPGVGIRDESPIGVALERDGNFVQKGDIIKHHEYTKTGVEQTSSKSSQSYRGSIFIPKSKQNDGLDTRMLEEKIGNINAPSGQQRVNPNAKVDSSYDNKVFLGDIDKIWTAGKKYREDITKQPGNQSNSTNSPFIPTIDEEDKHDGQH